MKDANGLTPKQALFVREYLIDKNGAQAAIRAGYSKRNASRIAIELLHKNHVSEQVNAGLINQQEHVEKKGLITAEEVVAGLKVIADSCRQMVPATDQIGKQLYSPDGIPLYKPLDPSGATRAYDLLGKYLGIYQTRSNLSVSLDGHVDVAHTIRTEGKRVARRLILEEVRDEPIALEEGETGKFLTLNEDEI